MGRLCFDLSYLLSFHSFRPVFSLLLFLAMSILIYVLIILYVSMFLYDLCFSFSYAVFSLTSFEL